MWDLGLLSLPKDPARMSLAKLGFHALLPGLHLTASPCFARGSNLCAIEHCHGRTAAAYYSIAHYWAARNGSPKIDDSPWDNIDADWIHQKPDGHFATRAALDWLPGGRGFALPETLIEPGH
jgi:hypothetical protein